MNIWLIKEGEPLPCDENPRLMRMGLLAKDLVDKGHRVIWWSSTFAHGTKSYRFAQQKVVPLYSSESFLYLLHSKVSYKKNISLSRLYYHRALSRAFLKRTKGLEKPDIIFCAFPTIDFAHAAVEYGKKNDVPVILDIRDLWPDIFVRALPKVLTPLSSLLLFPLQKKTRRVLSDAYGLTGIIPSHLNWALKKIPRSNGRQDNVFYIGYERTVLTCEERTKEIEFWQSVGVSELDWNICFFGTMSALTMDLVTIIDAMKDMKDSYPDIKLVLCGEGDGLDYFKERANGVPNIVFPGWVNKNKITALMEMSKVGVYPFHNLPDFINSLTNKMIEYFSGGLSVLSSIKGFSKKYIEDNNLGLVYNEGSPESFISSLLRIYNDEELRKEMSKNSYFRYCQDFQSKIINNKILNYFDNIVLNIKQKEGL